MQQFARENPIVKKHLTLQERKEKLELVRFNFCLPRSLNPLILAQLYRSLRSSTVSSSYSERRPNRTRYDVKILDEACSACSEQLFIPSLSLPASTSRRSSSCSTFQPCPFRALFLGYLALFFCACVERCSRTFGTLISRSIVPLRDRRGLEYVRMSKLQLRQRSILVRCSNERLLSSFLDRRVSSVGDDNLRRAERQHLVRLEHRRMCDIQTWLPGTPCAAPKPW